ncbi:MULTISPECIES: transporter substrate-binding domain-containing protein [unclassified Mesorhizobium]|uniref:transporter substrate-binding domain-containing protein n=1 Tax=unclassified Mesorhizobium TaxID=325217 RepID=UPI00095B90EA|nr:MULTISPECIES: transporter substrate-binding domain-containing protein [unclassified Mesorhizobium]MBN9259090.1 transporter substrate-binding domain-containing protein [Mesorhizobium sp.]MBN9273719.1 transporter substrate-binding domain-containing protein [Mesorhizobium sp.]OJX83564.1 MAG: ABC transporter substrate-binding protein [Mesorhizobium sp. 65-26]
MRIFQRGTGALLAGIVLMLAALVPSIASAQSVEDIIARGKLIVAIDTTTPPYGFLDADLKPTGFDIEVANKMGEALGVPVEFVTVTSPGRIPALLTKQVDAVISIFSITPQRAIQIDYSIPYAGQSAVVIAPKSVAIKGVADLVGKKVGLTRGTGEDGLLTKAAEANPGIQILRFDDYSSLLQAMVSGQIDAMGGGDYGEIYLKKAQNGDAFEQKYVLKTFYFGIGVAKGNDNLRQWINTWLFSMKTDGTLDALSMKYRNQPLPVLPVF